MMLGVYSYRFSRSPIYSVTSARNNTKNLTKFYNNFVGRLFQTLTKYLVPGLAEGPQHLDLLTFGVEDFSGTDIE